MRPAHPNQPTTSALHERLPSHLWKALARNGITTLEQVEQAYPDKLLVMPYIGPRTFRQIEEHLFPGQRYVPSPKEADAPAVVFFVHREAPYFRRAQSILRRFDGQSSQQLA